MFHIIVAILRAIFFLFTGSARDIIIENVIRRDDTAAIVGSISCRMADHMCFGSVRLR